MSQTDILVFELHDREIYISQERASIIATMFAVKGWSVDPTALKPQTELFKSGKHLDQNGEEKHSRKRKRSKSTADGEDGKPRGERPVGKKTLKEKKAAKHEKKKLKKDEKDVNKVPLGSRPDRTEDVAELPVAQSEVDVAVPTEPVVTDQANGKSESRGPDGESHKVRAKGRSRADAVPPPIPPLPATAKLTPMQAAMRQKLVSARFRHLNQTLYTAPSKAALDLFDQNPEMFEDYHAGFRQQVEVWPENPLDNMIATLRTRGLIKQAHSSKDKKSKGKPAPETTTEDMTGKLAPLPRTHGTAIIADLGCGDARLSQTLKDSDDTQKLQLQIHSYDLHSPSPLVTKADISALPLADGSADIAIFCLALMGTNWISFIEEAYRVLHWKGELWVAEIKSRFGRVGRAGKVVEHSVGNKKKQAASIKAKAAQEKEEVDVDEQTALRTVVDGVETKQPSTDVSAFVDVLRRRGFVLKEGEKSVDLSNKMFVKIEFIKAAAPVKGKGLKEEVKKAPLQARKKFVEAEGDDDIAEADEAKVLKPCLYKVR